MHVSTNGSSHQRQEMSKAVSASNNKKKFCLVVVLLLLASTTTSLLDLLLRSPTSLTNLAHFWHQDCVYYILIYKNPTTMVATRIVARMVVRVIVLYVIELLGLGCGWKQDSRSWLCKICGDLVTVGLSLVETIRFKQRKVRYT